MEPATPAAPLAASPLAADAADLPRAVAEALRVATVPDPAIDTSTTVDAAGIAFSMVAWGDPMGSPILLVHGVGSSVETWWRVGPALAATGCRVVAVDLPGHGRTGQWTGHHRFRDAATDIAAFIVAAGLDRAAPDLASPNRTGLRVVGHSFGAMATAALPLAGLRPDRLVLLDPPAASLAGMRSMAEDPVERHFDDLDEAVRVVGLAYPTWPFGDVLAKAVGLHRVDPAAAEAILLANGDWDGGVTDLAAADALPPTWVVRGDPGAGGLTFDAALPALGRIIGADRIVTLAGAPHSPQRTHIEAMMLALIRTLELAT